MLFEVLDFYFNVDFKQKNIDCSTASASEVRSLEEYFQLSAPSLELFLLPFRALIDEFKHRGVRQVLLRNNLVSGLIGSRC